MVNDYIVHASFQRYLASECSAALEHLHNLEDLNIYQNSVVPGESMAVDKDLFGNGSKMYGEETCCILPQTLNTMMTNCKKHDNSNYKTAAGLPLGVRYNEKTNMYYGEITPFGHQEAVPLTEWATPEEAFAEYKIIKQADILVMVTKYKNYLPQETYEALIKYEVKPYLED